MGRAEDEQIVREFLHRSCELVVSGDTESYLAMWADDGVFEVPYFPDESARIYAGKAAIAGLLSRMPLAGFENFAFFDMSLRATDAPGEFVAEMRSEGTRRSGQAYRNRYCAIATVRDGRIVQYREYFDPTRIPGQQSAG